MDTNTIKKKIIYFIFALTGSSIALALFFNIANAIVVYSPSASLSPGDITSSLILDGTILSEDINQTSNFGLGTTTPYAKLSVVGEVVATYFTATSTTATSSFSTGGLAVGTSQFVVQQNSGRVGIGTSTPNNIFHVPGYISFVDTLEATFLGYEVALSNTGNASSYFGYQSGYSNTSGINNTGIGAYALTADTSGGSNTGIGYGAGYAITSGSNNILLGYQAAGNLTTGSNNIIIGYDISAPSAAGNYKLNIGNAIYGDLSTGYIGIGTTTPASLLHIYSTATTTEIIDSSSATKGGCLKIKDVDGSGYTYCVVNNGTLTCSTNSCQ